MVDTLVGYKNIIDEYQQENSETPEEPEQRCRACNISVRPSTLDRIDRIWEQGYVEHDNRSSFLRDIILKRIAEIEAENDLQGGDPV